MRPIFILVALIACIISERVEITVFYDALDISSIEFILNQLYPTYNGYLKGTMDLLMAPVSQMTGRRNLKKEWEWSCVKGPINCYANKVHACIYKKIPHKDFQMEYVVCLMKATRGIVELVEYPLSSCLVGADYENIKTCADSHGDESEGDKYLAYFKTLTMTLKNPLHTSPAIALNNEINDTFLEEAKKNFAGLICKNMKENSEICEVLMGIENAALTHRLTSVALFSSLLLISFF